MARGKQKKKIKKWGFNWLKTCAPQQLEEKQHRFLQTFFENSSDATEEFYYAILCLHPPTPPSSVNLKTDGAKNLWEKALSIGVDSPIFTAELWGPQESFIYIYSML